MNTSSDNLDEGIIDNYKNLRKVGKEVEDMTKPLRNQASKSLSNVVKNLTKGNKKNTNIVKQSDVSKKAAEFTKDYNKTKEVKVPKPKVTRITPAMKEKAFKQSFGKPTGADWKTGKGTYTPPKNITNRNLYVDKTGKPTEKGIDKYITNRNTKGKFKGADIKPETVSKGLEKTAKDIKNPTVRQSTAAQIKNKYGGRRANRSPDPWKKGDYSVPKTNPDVTKARQMGASGMDSNVTGSQKLSTPKAKPTPKVVSLKGHKANKGTDALLDKLNSPKRNKLELSLEKGTSKPSATWKPAGDSSSQKLNNSIKKLQQTAGTKHTNSALTGAFKDVKTPNVSNPFRTDTNPGSSLVKSPSSGLVKPPSGGLVKPPTGGKLIKPTEGGKLTVYKPKPVDPITKIKLNYPKRGVHTGSSWVTRGYAKQFGAVNAIGSGITKYKQERAKGRSRLASATAGTLKGGTKGVGTYAGTIIGTKFGGKIGGLVGGTIGGAIGGRAYEIGKNISNVTKKTFKGFRKTPYNKTPEYKKLFKDNNKGETKLRIAS